MYIKTKHLKQFILIFACLFLIGFNYLNFVKADNVSKTCNSALDSDCDGLTNEEEKLYGTDPNNADTGNCGYSDGVNVKAGYSPLTCQKFGNEQSAPSSNDTQLSQTSDSLTKTIAYNLNEYIKEKGNSPISTDDIKNFTDTQILNKLGDPITFDTLPEIDASQIKILKQPYANLSEADRKIKEKEDASKYIANIMYLLLSNSPQLITTKADAQNFINDFMTRVTDPESNSEYFFDMGIRLSLFREQLAAIEVPETMVALHTKFLRLIDGVLTLKEMPKISTANDPMAGVLTLSKATQLIDLTNSFFINDLANYLKQLN